MKRRAFTLLLAAMLLVCTCVVGGTIAAAATDDFEYAEADGGATIVRYLGDATDVTIPDTLGGMPVVGIRASAFWQSAITSICIPGSVTEIGVSAFANCANLASVTIRDGGLTAIREYAFAYCAALQDVRLPNTLVGIGANAFTACASLPALQLPDGLAFIGDGAFMQCAALQTANMPKALISVGQYAFYGSGLQSLSLPNSVEWIGVGAFASCPNLAAIQAQPGGRYEALSGVLIDRHFATLVQYPAGRQAALYILPQGVQKIGSEAFSGAALLTDVVLSPGVTSVAYCAFELCPNLQRLAAARSVDSVDAEAFTTSYSDQPIERQTRNVTAYGFAGSSIETCARQCNLPFRAVVPGDVAEQGAPSAYAALLTLQYSLGTRELSAVQFLAADMDESGSVTAFDALRVLQASLGI